MTKLLILNQGICARLCCTTVFAYVIATGQESKRGGARGKHRGSETQRPSARWINRRLRALYCYVMGLRAIASLALLAQQLKLVLGLGRTILESEAAYLCSKARERSTAPVRVGPAPCLWSGFVVEQRFFGTGFEDPTSLPMRPAFHVAECASSRDVERASRHARR